MADDNLPVPVRVRARDVPGPGRGQATRFDEVRRQTYLQLIRQGYRRVKSAELVGVSYRCVVDRMRTDEDFHNALLEAEEARIDEVEEALFESAISGNVTAQQVVLFNRRPDQWANASAVHVRRELERAAAEKEAEEDERPAAPKDALRSRILELRERLIENAAETDPTDPDPQP